MLNQGIEAKLDKTWVDVAKLGKNQKNVNKLD